MQCDIELNASQSPVRYSFSSFFFCKKNNTPKQNKKRSCCHIINNENNSTTNSTVFFFLIFRPAYCGATKGQTETLRFLVQHQADLWLRSTKGDVSLHEAVACGRKDLVLWILRQCQQQYGENGTGSVGSDRKVQLALEGLTWSTTTAAVHCTSPPLITTWKCARYVVPFCWELFWTARPPGRRFINRAHFHVPLLVYEDGMIRK